MRKVVAEKPSYDGQEVLCNIIVWAKLFNVRPLHFPLQDLIILRNAFDLLLPKVRSWQQFPISLGLPMIGDGHHFRINQCNVNINGLSSIQMNDSISDL